MDEIVLSKKGVSSKMIIPSKVNIPLAYIKNDMFSVPIYNIHSIEWSLYLKSFHDDFPNESEYYISNNFKKDSITLYIDLIDLISSDKSHIVNIYLKSKNITTNFLEFINYIESDIIIEFVSQYLNLNFSDINHDVFNLLNYDIKFSIFLYCDVDNIPKLFINEAYFYSKWNEKLINGDITFDHEYPATFTASFKTYESDIIGKVRIYKKTNNIEFNYDNDKYQYNYHFKPGHTYYDNYFSWKIIRKHLIDRVWIEKFDNIYMNKPKFVNYKKDNFDNYDDLRGCFLQINSDDKFKFTYIQSYDDFPIISLKIYKYLNRYDIELDLNIYYVMNHKYRYDISSKKLWDDFKDKLIIDEKNWSEFERVINFFENPLIYDRNLLNKISDKMREITLSDLIENVD